MLLLARQRPAYGAVAQRRHPVRHARIAQRLRADDAARATGAIDDDGGGRIWRDGACAQRQLGAGHADAAGDAHGLVFVVAARIEDDDVGLRIDQRLHFLGLEERRMGKLLHQFAALVEAGRLAAAVKVVDARAVADVQLRPPPARAPRCASTGGTGRRATRRALAIAGAIIGPSSARTMRNE